MTELRALAETDSAERPQTPREQHQLHDFILVAVHRACDLHEFAAAKQLLASAEAAIRQRSQMPETKRRQIIAAIVAAHERLWTLRNDPRNAARRISVV